MSEASIVSLAGEPATTPTAAERVRPADAGRTDRAIAALAATGVTGLTALGWLLSYTALRQLALSAGLAAWAATLWPFCVDLFVFVATLAAIANRRRGRSTVYAWTLATLYSAATVAGNLAVAGPDHVAQAVHAIPAVTMVLAWHLLSGFFRSGHGHDRTSTRAVRTDQSETDASRRRRRATGARIRGTHGPVVNEVAAWVAEHELAGRRPTGDELALRFGVSDRTGRRLLSDLRSLTASGAG